VLTQPSVVGNLIAPHEEVWQCSISYLMEMIHMSKIAFLGRASRATKTNPVINETPDNNSPTVVGQCIDGATAVTPAFESTSCQLKQ